MQNCPFLNNPARDGLQPASDLTAPDYSTHCFHASPMALARIILKPSRDGPVRGGNPWIFSQAIERCDPAGLEPGEPVEVLDASGASIGVGYYNPKTTIAVRMLAWGGAIPFHELIAHRLSRALELRRRVVPADSDCY